MRIEATKPEDVLWEQLRNRKLHGLKFRRQHSISRFILDFYCPEAKLGVEIDGPVHRWTKEEDHLREKHIEAHGIRMVRFSNDQVLNNLDEVIENISRVLQDRIKTA